MLLMMDILKHETIEKHPKIMYYDYYAFNVGKDRMKLNVEMLKKTRCVNAHTSYLGGIFSPTDYSTAKRNF